MRISDWSSDVCSSDLNRSTKPALVPSGVEICRYHYVARIADQEYDRPVGEKRRIMTTMADQDQWHGRPPLKLESRDAPYRIKIELGQNAESADKVRLSSGERRVGQECGSTCRYRV